MLSLFKHYLNRIEINKYLEKILSISSVSESVSKSLRWYIQKNTIVKSSSIEVRLDPKLVSVYKLKIPTEGAFPKSFPPKLKELAKGPLFSQK